MANAHLPKGHRHPNCKICQSGKVDEVDNMLAAGVTQPEIARWLNKHVKNKRAVFKVNNVCNHNRKHRLPAMDELNFNPKLNFTHKKQDCREKYPKEQFENLPKAPDEKSYHKDHDLPPSKSTEEKARELIKKPLILTTDQFLDLIINKVIEDIADGKMNPSVSEAVKAAEIKAKSKDSSDHEKTLLNFFMGISQEHGYIRKTGIQRDN
jgi:hypothetical protein